MMRVDTIEAEDKIGHHPRFERRLALNYTQRLEKISVRSLEQSSVHG
jgi:hypothetical protein